MQQIISNLKENVIWLQIMTKKRLRAVGSGVLNRRVHFTGAFFRSGATTPGYSSGYYDCEYYEHTFYYQHNGLLAAAWFETTKFTQQRIH